MQQCHSAPCRRSACHGSSVSTQSVRTMWASSAGSPPKVRAAISTCSTAPPPQQHVRQPPAPAPLQRGNMSGASLRVLACHRQPRSGHDLGRHRAGWREDRPMCAAQQPPQRADGPIRGRDKSALKQLEPPSCLSRRRGRSCVHAAAGLKQACIGCTAWDAVAAAPPGALGKKKSTAAISPGLLETISVAKLPVFRNTAAEAEAAAAAAAAAGTGAATRTCAAAEAGRQGAPASQAACLRCGEQVSRACRRQRRARQPRATRQGR